MIAEVENQARMLESLKKRDVIVTGRKDVEICSPIIFPLGNSNSDLANFLYHEVLLKVDIPHSSRKLIQRKFYEKLEKVNKK
jgi:hypothetical protein